MILNNENGKLTNFRNKPPRGPYIFSTTTPIPIISSTKVPKYQNFKINFNGKTKLKSLSQYAPKDIIPVMRSVPNPDSINNAIVNLAQSEPLREKVRSKNNRTNSSCQSFNQVICVLK